MSKFVCITRETAEMILDSLAKFEIECAYQINEAPFEHSDAGLALWEQDLNESVMLQGILRRAMEAQNEAE